MVQIGWTRIECWNGVFVHVDKSIMVLYVDDFMLIASEGNAKEHWHRLGQLVEFGAPSAPILKYLGAFYRFDEPQLPSQPRTLTTSMSMYLQGLVARFQEEYAGPLRKCATPYSPDSVWQPELEQPGRFQKNCASYTASALFAALVCRPDLSVAVQRMCSRISRWAAEDDAALVRFMSYISWNHDLELTGTLGPDDEDELELCVWPDADWNGDSGSTRSTSGGFLELVGGARRTAFR